MAGEAHALKLPFHQRRLGSLALFGLIFGAAVAVIGAMAISPILAPLVPIGIGFGWMVWKLPLRVTVLALLACETLFEGLNIPLGGTWEIPVLAKIAELFFVNLNSLTGIGVLRLPLVDLACVIFAISGSLNRNDPTMTSQVASARALNAALVVQFAAVVGLDVLGAIQGGNINESLWQMRQLLLFGVRTVMFLRAFDGTTAQLVLITRVLIGVTFVKSLVGIYFLHVYVPANGMDVEFTTSHSDTILFVTLLMVAFNLLLERFTWQRVLRMSPWLGVIVFGMLANDRRLAWVSLGGSVFASFAMSGRSRLKRGLLKVALVAGPIVPLYLIAGWNSESALFGPAQLIKGMMGGESHGTTDYRDIENFNVLSTWAQHAFFPLGFGHMFQNTVPLPDISRAMPTWQYHPHNQYLWLNTIGSPFGFTLMLVPWTVGLLLAARAYRYAKSPIDRAAAMTLHRGHHRLPQSAVGRHGYAEPHRRVHVGTLRRALCQAGCARGRPGLLPRRFSSHEPKRGCHERSLEHPELQSEPEPER